MAVRRTVLILGDLAAAGQSPVSELTAINAGYAAAQTDCHIWNIQTQAWEQLTPGTNTNSSTPATSFWGLESRLREGLRSKFPTGNIYVIKHAVDSAALPSAALGNWEPGTAGNAYASLITQITNAAAAAVLAGDTLSINGIVTCLITDGFRLSTWRSTGSAVQQIINSLRAAVIAGCAFGSFRDDGGLTPTVVLTHHHGSYGGLTSVQTGQLIQCRMMLEMLENDIGRVQVARGHRYTAHANNETFDAQSMVTQGADVANRFWDPIYNDGANPEARMVLQLGDSTAEGWLTDNAQLPAHQQAALTGAKIWRVVQGDFQTLQVAVNNMTSVLQFFGHGIEINLADRMRAEGAVWFVKGTQINAFASDYRGLIGVTTPPHEVRDIVSFSSGRGQLQDLHIRGSFTSAIDELRIEGRKPVLDLVVISLGINDTLISYGADASQVVDNIKSMISRVREICINRNVKTDTLKFVVMVPASYALTADPIFTVDPDDLGLVRDGLLALSEPDIFVVDLSEHAAGADSFHQSTAGVKTMSDAVYTIWNSASVLVVQPLFSPNISYLRAALRLSKIGDDNDALAIIDNAVLSVRGTLYRELGTARIDGFRAIAFNRNPRTADDHLRIVAADVEIKMVRAQLMRSMPLMFMDGAAPIQTWQEEGAFREGGYLQVRDELARLEREIESGLNQLRLADLSKYLGTTFDTIGGEENMSPGASVFGTF